MLPEHCTCDSLSRVTSSAALAPPSQSWNSGGFPWPNFQEVTDVTKRIGEGFLLRHELTAYCCCVRLLFLIGGFWPRMVADGRVWIIIIIIKVSLCVLQYD